jgi:hypothetical protein
MFIGTAAPRTLSPSLKPKSSVEREYTRWQTVTGPHANCSGCIFDLNFEVRASVRLF